MLHIAIFFVCLQFIIKLKAGATASKELLSFLDRKVPKNSFGATKTFNILAIELLCKIINLPMLAIMTAGSLDGTCWSTGRISSITNHLSK